MANDNDVVVELPAGAQAALLARKIDESVGMYGSQMTLAKDLKLTFSRTGVPEPEKQKRGHTPIEEQPAMKAGGSGTQVEVPVEGPDGHTVAE